MESHQTGKFLIFIIHRLIFLTEDVHRPATTNFRHGIQDYGRKEVDEQSRDLEPGNTG